MIGGVEGVASDCDGPPISCAGPHGGDRVAREAGVGG